MQIQFHGAVRTVTGSQHLLTINGYKILLDCGLYQGKRQESHERNKHLPFDCSEVDVMVLSHAHIDHSGNIPNLVKNGFKGDIICTYATRDLCAIMLRDSAKIQESDIEYLNRKRQRNNLPPVEPIYEMEDAIESLNHFIGIGYNRPYRLLPDISLTFYDAGHILGSAIVVLEFEDKDVGKQRRLVFSGDLGQHDRPILDDPVYLDEADILLLESTYGNREHEQQAPANAELRDVVNRVHRQQGKVIVPAFAVGRTQELVYRLHQLMEAGEIPNIPVYVDSPLAINATGVYRLHPEAYDAEMANMLLEGQDPFASEMMRYTRSVAESKSLNDINFTAVIISASGMAEVGRILHHLRNNIEDPRNVILIVGWQAPHTLGRRLVEKQPEVKIFGQKYKLRAEVVTMNGFSGHADHSGLMKWATHMKQRPLHTFLVHGELEPGEVLARNLRSEGFKNVAIPELGQTFDI